MDSNRVRGIIVDFVFCILFLVGLSFLVLKSNTALSKAKEQFSWQEPLWESGTATTGTAIADGELTRTGIFFKAQNVILEYDVDGDSYTCESRMAKKEFDKLDGSNEDGKGEVLLRYDPQDPSRATTEPSVKILKQEKNAYFAVKWLCILYLIYYAIYFIVLTTRTIRLVRENSREKALERRREEVRKKAQQAAANKPKPAPKPQTPVTPKPANAASATPKQPTAAPATPEPANAASATPIQPNVASATPKSANPAPKSIKAAETPAAKQADRPSPDWQALLDDVQKEIQKREKAQTGSPDDWSKILDDAANEAKERQNNGVIQDRNNSLGSVKEPDAPADNGTVYDSTVYDGTVYDGNAPADNGTVYDGTVYDGTVYDGTVYDGNAPVDNGTVYDGTVYDGNAPADNRTIYDGTIYDVSAPTDDGTEYDADGQADNGTVYDAPADIKTSFDVVSTSMNGGQAEKFVKGNTVLSTYRIDSDPIVGGMGSVWKVHHTGWDVDLAVKRPKMQFFKTEKQKANFIGECEAWINLGIHPNIVACYYVREIDGVLSIFSEWMDKGSLEDRIRDQSVYAGTKREVGERLLDIAIQFAEGLHYAHESNLIHRDVKPDNVLLTEDWDARVADFGIAQLGGKGKNSGAMTPAYCSPEQVAGKKLGRRTDIYSWAVSILELYLGRKPWAHSGQMTGPLAGEACRDYFAMCEEHPIPSALQNLLEKCMKSDLRNRPQNFGSVIKELKNIYKAETGRAYPRPVSKASAESADNLNNRALSYMDLGRSDEMESLWTRAALMEPSHTETLFNRCLYGYRSGAMTLYEAQCFLSANWENHFNQAEPGLLLAELSLEGNDHYNAKDVLSYVRNYSTQQEVLSPEALQKLSSLETQANGGTWHCSYQLSRVKNYKEQENLRHAREEKLEEIRALAQKGKWDDAGTQFLMSHLSQSLGDVIYQKDWMEFYEEMSRKCTPVLVLAHWPVMTIPNTRFRDRVSFSEDSQYLLCGNRLYDMATGEKIADNGEGLKKPDVYLSDLSPDGSFYLRAPMGECDFVKVDALTGETLTVCRGHEDSITALAISRDGKRLASGDSGGTLKLWDENGNLIKTTNFSRTGDEMLEDIQFGYDNRQMVLRYEETLYLDNELDKSMRQIPYDDYLEVAVDLGFTAIGMAAGRKGLHYFDMQTNQERALNDEDAVRRRGSGINTAARVCFMHNQKFLLVSDRQTLLFFDPGTNKILSAIHIGENCRSIAVSRDGKYVAAISGGKAQIWRCMYGLRYIGTDTDYDFVRACAHIQRSAHPEAGPEQLLPVLLKELGDRGYGSADIGKVLTILQTVRN